MKKEENFTMEEIEASIWALIDGQLDADQKDKVQLLVNSNLEWKRKYQQLLEFNELLKSSELEEPSMRFTRNVMEEITKYHIAPATRTYINKRIIWGLAAFFILMIGSFLAYGFSELISSGERSNTNEYFDFSTIDYSKIFNNAYVNIFLFVNIIVGFFLLDRWLAFRREKSRGISF